MKKNKTLLLVLGVLLAAALVLGLILGIMALNKRTQREASGTEAPTGGAPVVTNETPSTGETPDPSEESTDVAPPETVEETPEMAAAKTKAVYTVEDIAADDPRLDQVVGSCGSAELTNRQLQAYYCIQLYGIVSQYGDYVSLIGLDVSKPLSEQTESQSGMTWEQFFLMSAVQQYSQFAPIAARAEAEGFILTEEDETELKDAVEFYWNNEDFRSLLSTATRYADFEAFMRSFYLVRRYEKSLYESVEVNEADLREYYDNHPELFDGIEFEDYTIDVRHILYLSDADGDETVTDEEKAAAKAKADAMLAEFRKDPSEERFAQLASENTEDPGSKESGGLYENVYRGQMVKTFNDWCFDSARKPGDTGVVETEYGYHVMYFVKAAEMGVVEMDYRGERTELFLDEILKESNVTVRYEDVVLAPLNVTQAQ